MRVILLGAPNTGKGTQASFISKALGIPPVSTGNLLREAIAEKTAAGLEAKGYMDAGNLVPDGLVVSILKDRLSRGDCANGFILDGFPRTVAQAETLEQMGISVDRVISLEVPDDEIELRACGRRACEGCGDTYHIAFKPPDKDGLCDRCGKTLSVRDDDRPETVRSRLRVFHERTEPVKDYYRARGKVYEVDSSGTVENTTAQMRKIFGIPQ